MLDLMEPVGAGGDLGAARRLENVLAGHARGQSLYGRKIQSLTLRLPSDSGARVYLRSCRDIGHLLDIGESRGAKPLKILARPSGIEPLSPP